MKSLLIVLLGIVVIALVMLATAGMLTGVGILLAINASRVIGAIICILIAELIFGIARLIAILRH